MTAPPASQHLEHWLCLLADVITAAIGGLACLELACPAWLPQTLKDALQFGKMRARDRGWTVVRLVEVPKRWFWHFYLAGLLASGLLLWATHWPYGVAMKYLASDLLAIPDVSNAPWINYIPLVLQVTQMLRRMLECLLVSIYSPSTMNLLHYFLGCSFYFCVVYALLLRLPAYSIGLAQAALHCSLHALLSYHQFRVAKIFASLRRNTRGAVVHHHHAIPEGHLFNYLSSPHYVLEMLIYLNLFGLTGFATGGLYFHLLLFVLVNQSTSSLITHAWYRREFRGFPRSRKALIPFVL